MLLYIPTSSKQVRNLKHISYRHLSFQHYREMKAKRLAMSDAQHVPFAIKEDNKIYELSHDKKWQEVDKRVFSDVFSVHGIPIGRNSSGGIHFLKSNKGLL